MATGRPNGVRLHPKHQDQVRLKIKVSQLLNRLQDFALGELKNPRRPGRFLQLESNQIRAIEILLRKAMPDLTKTEHSGQITLEQLVMDARAQSTFDGALGRAMKREQQVEHE